MDKRYQIFVSSTFRDLIEERTAVLNAILEMDHIPAGMELFPAAHATPWDLIRGVISLSDYYVLIIAGMYGSTTAEGISYTEAEYDYAVTIGKPVLAFLHERPLERPGTTIELDPAARARLDEFRKKVEAAHTRTTWSTPDNLKSKVIIGLISAFKAHPAVGWVRADGVDNTELLKKLSAALENAQTLEKENARLRVAAVTTSGIKHDAERIARELLALDAEFLARIAKPTVGDIDQQKLNTEPWPGSDSSELRASIAFEELGLLAAIPNSSFVRVTQLGWAVSDEVNKLRVMRHINSRLPLHDPLIATATMLDLSPELMDSLAKSLIEQGLAGRWVLENGTATLTPTTEGILVAQRFAT